MIRPIPIVAALLALSACGGAEPAAPAVAAPIVRLAAVPGRPASGYFQLRIEGDRGALVSVASPEAGRIEMHETMAHGSMTSMRPLERIPVRDGEMLSFAPGGRHLMLFDLDARVAAGGRVTLVLHFERGAPETLTAEVVPAGGDAGH
jgi:copper(I)-binding protein